MLSSWFDSWKCVQSLTHCYLAWYLLIIFIYFLIKDYSYCIRWVIFETSFSFFSQQQCFVHFSLTGLYYSVVGIFEIKRLLNYLRQLHKLSQTVRKINSLQLWPIDFERGCFKVVFSRSQEQGLNEDFIEQSSILISQY